MHFLINHSIILKIFFCLSCHSNQFTTRLLHINFFFKKNILLLFYYLRFFFFENKHLIGFLFWFPKSLRNIVQKKKSYLNKN